MKVPKKITLLTTLFCIGFTYCQEKKAIIADSLIWQKGYLDIHFIHTGKGNASFMVFPDGTTLLYDAGDAISGGKKPRYPSFESDSFTVGQIIHKYIKAFSPNQEIDYALISHFHADHYGALRNGLIKSNKGDFYLTGITEVGELIPIKKLIDRGYPNYDYPIDRRFKPGDKSTLKSKEKDSTFLNYLSYIQTHQKQGGLVVEKFLAGSNRQIKMVNSPESYPEFSVQNLKVNNRIWTGNGNNIRELEFKPPLINKFGYYNENPLSLALKIAYGDFDYYVGGDTSGVDDYPDYDIESEMIEIIGEVDAMTLDHHGYKDASNTLFLKHLRPQVIVHQSLHDPHFSENIQQNLLKTKSDVFSLFVGDKIKNKYGNQIDTIYKQKKGHFFIRVYPKGQKFEVITLKPDSSLSLNKKYGPYTSKK